MVFIDCLVLLDIVRMWGRQNVHPRSKAVVHFDVIYPCVSGLLKLRQWTGDLVLIRIKRHSGCLMNERADEYAGLGQTIYGSELGPGPKKYCSLSLRVKPICRDYAHQYKKQLRRGSAHNKVF